MLAADYRDKAESIDAYLDNFGILLDMNKLMAQLSTDGHCDYQNYIASYNVDSLNGKTLASKKEELENECKAWADRLLRIRLRYYFTCFFTIKQLLAIIAAHQRLDVNELSGWLRLIDSQITPDQIKALCSSTISPPDQYGSHLQDLGAHLDAIFSGTNSRLQHTMLSYAKMPGEFREGQMNYVAAASLEDTLCTCLSLYAGFGHFPAPEELLIASRETTEEEVELFLLRCLGATSHAVPPKAPTMGEENSLNTSGGRPFDLGVQKRSLRVDNLYCLAHAEKLSIELQERIAGVRFTPFQLISSLDSNHVLQSFLRLTSYYPGNDKFRLVVLCNTQDRQVELPLVRGKLPVSVGLLPNSTLKAMLAELFKARQMNVTPYMSEAPGAGKSHTIATQCAENGLTAVTVAINRQLTIDEFVAAFVQAQNRLSKSSDANANPAWILAVGHLVTPQFNLQLFQLLVLGYLQTSAGTIFWPPSSSAGVSYYIELPNSVVDLKLFFPTKLLPVVNLPVAAVTLDVSSTSPIFAEEYFVDQAIVSQNRVQYVCKFLHFLSTRTDMGRRNFHPHHHPDLSTEEYACICAWLIHC